MDYVKFYKKITNTNHNTKKYSIHHIDENRENNDISNLVMLPKKLHLKYHSLKKCIDAGGLTIETRILSMSESGYGCNEYYLNLMKKFIECWKECCEWNDYKYFLLGEMPNIHQLYLED